MKKLQVKPAIPLAIVIMLIMAFVISTIGSTMRVNAEIAEIENVQGIVGPYTLDESEMEVEVYQINLSTAEEVDESIVSQEESNIASSTEGVVNVEPRDWSRYNSDTFRNNMSSAELAFYDRLVVLAEYYMNSSTIDAYYVATYNMYAVNGVAYNDLGLTSDQAFLTAEWFIYNNPQYYFIRPKVLTTNKAIYLGCYDVVADGDDRAAMTNAMFATIDSWITTINDDEVTNYDKILSAHDLVCNNLNYISNDYDQSLYSSVMLGETVCAGYAELLTVLLNASDVDTMVCINDCHAWNIVMLDDYNYYGMDATWDDSLHSQLFMACGYDTLRKYDTELNEHVMGSYWANWIPEMSLSDYNNSAGSSSEITLDSPVMTVENVDTNAIRVKWDAVDSASKYEIEVYDANTNSLLGKKTTTSCSLKLTSVADGATLYVRCRAIRSVNGVVFYSDWSDLTHTIGSAIEETPSDNGGNSVTESTDTSGEQSQPEAITVNMPADLLVSDIEEERAIITWGSVSDINYYTFEVYSDSNYTNLLLTNDRTSNRVILTGLADNTTYYVRVSASVISDGQTYTSEWAYSSFTTLEHIVIDVAEPTNMVTSNITASSGKVTWDAAPNASKYEIAISTTADFSNITAGGTVTSSRVNLTGLQSNTTYYVRVRTVQYTDSETLYSDWVSTQFTSSIVVDKVSGLGATKISDTSTRLYWTAVPNATSYEIKVYSDNAYTNLLVSGNVRGSSIRLSGLQKGCTYYIAIRTVVNDGTNTYYSDWVNARITK